MTGADGTAEVELPLPENTTEWRLTARGATVETLVGEATASVVTRKDFFVEIKAPASLQERDQVRVLARVHNLGSYEGDAEVVAHACGAGPTSTACSSSGSGTVRVEEAATAEVLLDAFEVPAELALEIRVDRAGGRPLRRRGPSRPGAPVGHRVRRPWRRRGARATPTCILELPAGPTYGSRWLTVIGRALAGARRPRDGAGRRAAGRRAAVRPRWGGHPASELLAAVSALEYARAVGAPPHGARADRCVGRAPW